MGALTFLLLEIHLATCKFVEILLKYSVRY